MVQLIPFKEDELQPYYEDAIPRTAEGMIRAGNWDPDRGIEISRTKFHDLLPKGTATEGQYLFHIFDEDSGKNVGVLWFGLLDDSTKVHVYDIYIGNEHRNKGFASDAFHLFEEKVRALGVSRISLYVMPHNHAARALYEKLGYGTTGLTMVKEL